MAIRTFGHYCSRHPHIHAIVADVFFAETGYSFGMPRGVDTRTMEEIFQAKVLQMLRKEGLVDDEFIRMIMKRCHAPGFSVRNKVRIGREDVKGQKALARYIIRNPFTVQKLHSQQATGQVIYRSKMSHGKTGGISWSFRYRIL